MTNSDYLLKATVKKLGEKLNQTFLEKIEDATIAAQEVPEFFKKELEVLKDEILNEAKRLENLDYQNNSVEEFDQEDNINFIISNKINEVNQQLEILNKQLDN